MVARQLALPGARVVAVDRRTVASGSTAASTALVLYEIDTPLVRLGRMIGNELAAGAYAASHDAVEWIDRLCRQLEGDAQASPRTSLYLSPTREADRSLEAEAAARHRLGIAAQLIDRRSLLDRYSIDRPIAIESRRALALNPVRLTLAALADAERHGAVVIEGVTLDLAPLGTRRPPYRLTAPGVTITADWVIFAGGYEVAEQFAPIARLTSLKSTYAIVTESGPPPPWGAETLLWGDGGPYFYCRSAPTERLMAGGADADATDPRQRDALVEPRTRIVRSWLQSLERGRARPLAFRWAGTFAKTADGLPYLGPHPLWPNVLFSLGFGGNGITFSAIAAHVNTAIVSGRCPALLPIFAFQRPGPAGIGPS